MFHTFWSFSAQFEKSVNLIVIVWGPEDPGSFCDLLFLFFSFNNLCVNYLVKAHTRHTFAWTVTTVSCLPNVIYAGFGCCGSHWGGHRAPFIYALSQRPLSSMLMSSGFHPPAFHTLTSSCAVQLAVTFHLLTLTPDPWTRSHATPFCTDLAVATPRPLLSR